jgi:hypothetical protein
MDVGKGDVQIHAQVGIVTNLRVQRGRWSPSTAAGRRSSGSRREAGGQVGAALVYVLPRAAARLVLHALAYNLTNFLCTLALPGEVAQRSLTRACVEAV